jgi:hypothetical protein
MKCFCGKTAKPIAVIQGERFYHQCAVCGDEYCADCSIVDDETGAVECIYCYQQRRLKEESVNDQ